MPCCDLNFFFQRFAKKISSLTVSQSHVFLQFTAGAEMDFGEEGLRKGLPSIGVWKWDEVL